MITTTCDRCGEKININPMGNSILPMFSVSMIKDFMSGWQSVDLCPKCEKSLMKWLRNEEKEVGEAHELTAQSEPKWIPAEDEPPKERRSYWVCTDIGYQCECRWTDNIYGLQESGDWGWSIFDIPQHSKVVAYMPLPKPYERSEDAEIH